MELMQAKNYPKTFSQMLDSFFNDDWDNHFNYNFVPSTDIIENEDRYTIQIAIPGMDKNDIKVEFKDSNLSVSGEKKFSEEKKDTNYHMVENKYGSFRRVFTIPQNCDESKIEAEYKDGMLNLILPKDSKKLSTSTIKIK